MNQAPAFHHLGLFPTEREEVYQSISALQPPKHTFFSRFPHLAHIALQLVKFVARRRPLQLGKQSSAGETSPRRAVFEELMNVPSHGTALVDVLGSNAKGICMSNRILRQAFATRLMLGFCIALAAWSNGLAIAKAGEMGSSAWGPVDRAAAKVFAQANTDQDGLLSKNEFRAAQPQLRSALERLVRRGALASIPPAALNAQTSGPMLPGQQKISKPEFTLFARSLALRIANPGRPIRAASFAPPAR